MVSLAGQIFMRSLLASSPGLRARPPLYTFSEDGVSLRRFAAHAVSHRKEVVAVQEGTVVLLVCEGAVPLEGLLPSLFKTPSSLVFRCGFRPLIQL